MSSTHESSAAAVRALDAAVEMPPGLTAEAQALGRKALANVPPAPRAPTGRMQSEELAILRGSPGRLIFGALVSAVFGVIPLLPGLGLVFGAPFFTLSVALTGLAFLKRRVNKRLITHGLPTLARIESVHAKDQVGAGVAIEHAFLRYTYRVRGEDYVGTANVDRSDSKELVRAGFVPIIYDAGNPQRSMPWLGALDL